MIVKQSATGNVVASVQDGDLVRRILSPSLAFNRSGITVDGNIRLGGLLDAQKLLKAKGFDVTLNDIINAPVGITLESHFKGKRTMATTLFPSEDTNQTRVGGILKPRMFPSATVLKPGRNTGIVPPSVPGAVSLSEQERKKKMLEQKLQARFSKNGQIEANQEPQLMSILPFEGNTFNMILAGAAIFLALKFFKVI